MLSNLLSGSPKRQFEEPPAPSQQNLTNLFALQKPNNEEIEKLLINHLINIRQNVLINRNISEQKLKTLISLVTKIKLNQEKIPTKSTHHYQEKNKEENKPAGDWPDYGATRHKKIKPNEESVSNFV